MIYKPCKCTDAAPQATMFIKNLREFESGHGTATPADPPVIELEGICRTCGVVVRAAEDLYEKPAGIIIDGLMHEVRRLRVLLEKTEAYAKEMVRNVG